MWKLGSSDLPGHEVLVVSTECHREDPGTVS